MVNVNHVTEFFQNKIDIRSLEISNDLKKKQYQTLLESLFPQSKNIDHHHEKLKKAISKLVTHFDRHNSKSIIWVGGSYPKGKIKSTHTDLDFYIALPHLPDEDDRLTELQIIKDFYNIGFLISEKISPIKGLLPVYKTGRGLARLSGFTVNGIELDFHFLGIKDVKEMHYAKSIKRVHSVTPYPEWRVSYTGKKQLIIKPSAIVLNWFEYQGQLIKGFYLDNFSALGDIVYDPNGNGAMISSNIWYTIMLCYIGNNTKSTFNGFLRTLYYQYPDEYSNEKLSKLKYRYEEFIWQRN